MARDKAYWDRWEHYQRHGRWPSSPNLNKKQFPAKKQNPTVVWERKNPDLAAYDNDGMPIERNN